MKVFAIRCSYKNASGQDRWIMRLGVSHGLEDILTQVESDLDDSEEGYQEGSLKLDAKVYMGMPDLLENIKKLQEGKKMEEEAVDKIKNFDHLIKK